ncbi:DUF2584 family protein [Aquibacillus salsiterrae]|uniref:DUF2584 domain-containing protein n=1 Tax=Aquibacillus salsiterrae TaxID=2950439 RepID=A0A9X4AEM2_9BACI|nr:DUF2584 family protein [Aquibacillus salsiterrae]MDC3415315.1 DUF2584 domain-containing protein [Aquibacillus salsiterrae]
MSMPLSIEWRLVTQGKEKRLENTNNMFELSFEGYTFFPINQLIEITRHPSSDQIGSGKIVELTWKDNKTICKYQLLSLFNVN